MKLPKKITVLSLFDGISCGQQALKKLNANIVTYYASEIEINAIKVSHKNFPLTKYLGYVENIKPKLLPKIDLILAGSPCQGFSNSGHRLNFNDPRSKLFFEFIRVLKEAKKINPKLLFLLENVNMKKEWQDIITKFIDVNPIKINSAALSAQNRTRLYWANFHISQPENTGLVLKDILQNPFYNGEHAKMITDTRRKINFNGALNVLNINKKAPCLTVQGTIPYVPVTFKTYRTLSCVEQERLQTLPDNYTAGVSNTYRKKMIANGWTVAVIKHILKPII